MVRKSRKVTFEGSAFLEVGILHSVFTKFLLCARPMPRRHQCTKMTYAVLLLGNSMGWRRHFRLRELRKQKAGFLEVLDVSEGLVCEARG